MSETIVGMMGSISAGRSAEKAADFNADLMLAQGKSEAKRIRRMGDFQQGEIRANVAKAGVTMSGSALEAYSEAVAVNETDALMTEYNAKTGAAAERFRGKMEKRRHYFEAAGKAFEGGRKMAQGGTS